MVDIYKDMLEKLKYHKELVMNKFIKNGYYPSIEEVNNTIKNVNARLSLFESYISKPGNYFNPTEINYCFEMIYKDIEILYKVLQDILLNEYTELKLKIESTLTELEAQAIHYKTRYEEEINTSALGTTIVFQCNNWNSYIKDELVVVDLGTHNFIDGSIIACIANINSLNEKDIYFEISNGMNTILALPYNFNNVSYKMPGELKVNKKEIVVGSHLIINDYVRLNYKTNSLNDYKLTGGKNLMSVTGKHSGITTLVNFPDSDNYSFYCTEDCYIEFYLVDGTDSLLEYNFNMAPTHCNFSLQDGTIKINSDIKRIFIEGQTGLAFSFVRNKGVAYAECLDAIITSKDSIIYNGNLDIKDIVLREYVKATMTPYKVKIYINSSEDILENIESVYIKEVS